MADEPELKGLEVFCCDASVVVVEGEESVTRCLDRRWCWEYGSPPVKSLLLGHCCYHYHPYFERRSGPSGFFSLMFLCWWNASSGFPSYVPSHEKHAQSGDILSCWGWHTIFILLLFFWTHFYAFVVLLRKVEELQKWAGREKRNDMQQRSTTEREPAMLRFMVGALIPRLLEHAILYFFSMSTSPMTSLSQYSAATLWLSATFVPTKDLKRL